MVYVWQVYSGNTAQYSAKKGMIALSAAICGTCVQHILSGRAVSSCKLTLEWLLDGKGLDFPNAPLA